MKHSETIETTFYSYRKVLKDSDFFGTENVETSMCSVFMFFLYIHSHLVEKYVFCRERSVTSDGFETVHWGVQPTSFLKTP